jgi:hypothetical protein
MAVLSRPFAYNPSLTPITGTDQIGTLAVGYPTAGFASTGLQWWEGPSEATGYVIAKPVSLGNQPTPVPEDALYMDPALKGPNIILSNNNQTATVPFGSVESVLGANVPISSGEPTMFIVRYNSAGSASLANRFIGVGQSSMNFLAPNGYPGNDNMSFGFNALGECFFNASLVASGLTSWNDGDIISIALANAEIWIRVNNGNWNNNPSANPTTPSTGFSLTSLVANLRAVLCPGINECTMTVLNYPPFGVPGGYNFLGNVSASVAFNRSSVLSEASFIELAETLTGQTFAGGDDAKTYLNGTMGYWTSWNI